MKLVLKLFGATAAIIILIEITLSVLSPSKALWLELDYPPQDGEVLIVGNSMFKTGIDLDQMKAAMNKPVAFNYFDGHYTNLWYLIFKNALAHSDQKPTLLIWGFRPHYATIPAFRKRKAGPIEVFMLEKEPTYESIVAATPLDWKEKVNTVLSQSRIFSLRDTIQSRLMTGAKTGAARLLDTLGPQDDEAWVDEVSNKSVSDILLATITDNRIAMSEELVADVAGANDQRFISGPRVEMAMSFVPHIARVLKDTEIPQLVVIFKPVSEINGTTSVEALKFKDDAIRFFTELGLPVANVFDELELDSSDYGKGDHYNSQGRAKVTAFISEKASAAMTRNLGGQ